MSSFGHAEFSSEIISLAGEILSRTKIKNESLYVIASNFYFKFSVIFWPLAAACFSELSMLTSVLQNCFSKGRMYKPSETPAVLISWLALWCLLMHLSVAVPLSSLFSFHFSLWYQDVGYALELRGRGTKFCAIKKKAKILLFHESVPLTVYPLVLSVKIATSSFISSIMLP